MNGQGTICAEIERRIEAVREEMKRRGYDALIVYGDNKVRGSLRYLTDFFPDRAGWISLGPTETYLFAGAVLIVSLDHDPVLLCDPGLVPGKPICVKRIYAGGFSATEEETLSKVTLTRFLKEAGIRRKIGVETWDRFPAPLYMHLVEAFPDVALERSTIVEELRMVKSPSEIALMRRAAEIGDEGHKTVLRELKAKRGRVTELEVIRIAEAVMRAQNAAYEDACINSPSLISTGREIAGALLHTPQADHVIGDGDVVHWDICQQHLGYSIDTSRTKVIGRATREQRKAYDTALRMFDAVVAAARPGVKAVELVRLADEIAIEAGFRLWDGFLGHGTGLEAHERPDLVKEETLLQENMTLALEPRVRLGNFLFGVEDVVVVTPEGGESLNRFEKEPLELEP